MSFFVSFFLGSFIPFIKNNIFFFATLFYFSVDFFIPLPYKSRQCLNGTWTTDVVVFAWYPFQGCLDGVQKPGTLACISPEHWWEYIICGVSLLSRCMINVLSTRSIIAYALTAFGFTFRHHLFSSHWDGGSSSIQSSTLRTGTMVETGRNTLRLNLWTGFPVSVVLSVWSCRGETLGMGGETTVFEGYRHGSRLTELSIDTSLAHFFLFTV